MLFMLQGNNILCMLWKTKFLSFFVVLYNNKLVIQKAGRTIQLSKPFVFCSMRKQNIADKSGNIVKCKRWVFGLLAGSGEGWRRDACQKNDGLFRLDSLFRLDGFFRLDGLCVWRYVFFN